jgi:hypothetical protein
VTARALVVDLAVYYEELRALPTPQWSRPQQWTPDTTRDRFTRWYVHGTRLFQLAIDAGCAVEQAHERPSDAIGALVRAVDDGRFLDELHCRLSDGLSYIGYETPYEYFYGGQPWDELCVYRSGVGFIHELCERPMDDEVETIMTRFGVDMWKPLEIPAGMPRRHWWWFGAAPEVTP